MLFNNTDKIPDFEKLLEWYQSLVMPQIKKPKSKPSEYDEERMKDIIKDIRSKNNDTHLSQSQFVDHIGNIVCTLICDFIISGGGDTSFIDSFIHTLLDLFQKYHTKTESTLFLISLVRISIKLIYHLYHRDENLPEKECCELFSYIINNIPTPILEQSLKLNDIFSMAIHRPNLKNLTEIALKKIISSINPHNTTEINYMEEIESTAALILSSMGRSYISVNFLCAYLSVNLLNSQSVKSIWIAVQIISLLINHISTSTRSDISATLESTLMSILSCKAVPDEEDYSFSMVTDQAEKLLHILHRT